MVTTMFIGYIITSLVSLLIGAAIMQRFGLTRVVERFRAADKIVLDLAAAQVTDLRQVCATFHHFLHRSSTFEACPHALCTRARNVADLAEVPDKAPSEIPPALLYDFANRKEDFLFNTFDDPVPPAAEAEERAPAQPQAIVLAPEPEPEQRPFLTDCSTCSNQFNVWESKSKTPALFCSPRCERRYDEKIAREVDEEHRSRVAEAELQRVREAAAEEARRRTQTPEPEPVTIVDESRFTGV